MSEAVAAAPARQAATAEPGAKPELRLQRKCACGQHTVAGGECEECRKKRLMTQRWSSTAPAPGAMLRNAGTSLSGDAPGADLSAVRAQTPALHTGPRIQREEAGAPAPESAETTEETQPEAVDTAPAPQSTEAPPPEQVPSAPESESSPESATAGARTGSLLAEDDAADVAAGQMRKTEFLDQLQRAVCAQADEALAAAGRSTEGCPYIAQAFTRYRGQSAAQVESALRRYAPETRNARTAAETIPILAARVRQGVERWVATGEISGVPDDVPISIPTGGLSGLLGGLASGIGRLLFKADEGGARPDDPAAVHAKLGDGQAMESGVRGRMERAFGRSFGGVRMHTDATARQLSAEQNARAFTVGGHVAFAAGEYRPGTPAGDALIAHELAHTIQQGSGSAAMQAKSADGAGYDALEHDADRSAAGVVARLWGAAKETAHGIARNTGPALRSGLSIQRCSPKPSQTKTPAPPGATKPAPGTPAKPEDAAPAKPEEATAPPKPAEPETEPVGGWCAKPATHTEIVALMKKAGKAEPVGTLAYGFTYWAKKDTAKKPVLSISYGPAPGGKVKGTVARTSTDIGSIEALYLQKGTYELPGKKFNVTGTGCGLGGKQVPIFSAVSEDMSLLARRAEQEHCDDYHRAFDLSYVKQVALINSIAGTPFIGASKAAVKADINAALAAKGDKGVQGWVDEINRLARISEATRDDGLLHRLKPDGDPQVVDAGCTRKDTTTVPATTTKVPGPKTDDIIK